MEFYSQAESEKKNQRDSIIYPEEKDFLLYYKYLYNGNYFNNLTFNLMRPAS